MVGPSGHTVACGGSWFSRSSDQQCQARHPQELKPVFGVTIWALVALLVPGDVLRGGFSLMGCLGLAGLGSGVPQHFGICRPSETAQCTLSRWQSALVSFQVPGHPCVPQPGVTVESGRDRVVRRAPRKEARTDAAPSGGQESDKDSPDSTEGKGSGVTLSLRVGDRRREASRSARSVTSQRPCHQKGRSDTRNTESVQCV